MHFAGLGPSAGGTPRRHRGCSFRRHATEPALPAEITRCMKGRSCHHSQEKTLKFGPPPASSASCCPAWARSPPRSSPASRRSARAVQADRLADPDGHHPPRQAHRQPHAADQRLRPARQARRHRVRRLGHLPDNAYEAAKHAGVLVSGAPRAAEGLPVGDQADDGRVRADVREEARRRPTSRRARRSATSPSSSSRTSRTSRSDERLRPPGRGVVRLDRGRTASRRAVHATLAKPSRRACEDSDADIAPSQIYAYAAPQDGRPLRQRRAEPVGRHAGAARAGASRTACRSPARTSRPARR